MQACAEKIFLFVPLPPTYLKFVSFMKLFKYIIILCLLSAMPLSAVYAQENNSYFLHTIERGQSLYSISGMYGVSQSDIISLNPGSDQKIYAGQVLRIPQKKDINQQEDIFHTIQQGETLYRLTTIYNVSAKDICDENPGLSAENFKIGEVIRIPMNKQITESQSYGNQMPQIQGEVKPRCKDMHKVKRKETIFSVSRDYGISEQELIDANPELRNGMKRGQLLCIPYPILEVLPPQNTNIATIPSNSDLFRQNEDIVYPISPIKAAIILPFTQTGVAKGESSRMIEFYEGFLIAVDNLKKRGISIDLYVYDSGDRDYSLNTILMKDELKSMNVIFGPLYQEHYKQLADFAEKHNIRLVVPTLSKEMEVYQNPWIYQINTPQSYLYSEVYQHFVRQFPNSNVIIVDIESTEVDKDKDKHDFIEGLKFELSQNSIPVSTVSEKELTAAALKNSADAGRNNVFIPTSSSNAALVKLMPQLKLLKMNNPELQTTLFGYPDWQIYTKDHLESFFEQNTYFYSSFYTNNLLPSAVEFIESFNKWYSKEMMNIYPRYGMLGYDTAYFFLYGLAAYGTGFDSNVQNVQVTPIQNGFKFERVNNWGGYINKKVFFVHFNKDFELVKLDFDL